MQHGMMKKRLAIELGMDPSYLSCVMRGRKGQPAQDLVDHIAIVVGLTVDEWDELRREANCSGRRLHIPKDATGEEYHAVHELVGRIGQLDSYQISAIREILKIEPRMDSARRQRRMM